MNDPDRQRAFDGFDDDAIFADIVAHLNQEAAEAERAERAIFEDAAADVEAANTDIGTTDTAAEGTAIGSNNPSTKPSPDPSCALPPVDIPGDDPGKWLVNPSPETPRHSDPQAVPGPLVWRAHEVDEEYEEHFEPPPVTPLPAGDLAFWAIIAGMSGGPLLLLYLVFFNRDASTYWILTAIAMSVGGFALLVSRMPGHHEDDDDGARL